MTLALAFNLAEINWLAVLVAAFATFMIGGVWYTALFGKLWQKLNGYSTEKLAEMKAERPPPVFFGTLIVCYAVVALIMAILVTTFNVTGAADGALLGLLLWIMAAAVGLTGHIASDKPMGAFAIDAAYQFIYLLMTGAIIAGWR